MLDQHVHPVRNVAVAGQHRVNAQRRWRKVLQQLDHLAPSQKGLGDEVRLQSDAHALRGRLGQGQAVVGADAAPHRK